MLKVNIAATLLAILWSNIISVLSHNESHINVSILRLWESFQRGLIYFDQCIIALHV